MLLPQLSDAIGVSGDEAAVRAIVLDAIQDHATDIHIDSIGNVTALKRGTGDNPLRLMIAAHMDEIGFMVTGFESNGLIRFTNVGGVDARILPGLRLKVGDKQVPGVVMWKPIHMNQAAETVEIKDLRIDIGVTSKKAAEEWVQRGQRIAFDSHYSAIEGGPMVRGKAFDDRVGVSLLIDILQGGPYPVDVLAAFTVQEEIGLRGAQVAAQRLQPDLAFALEGTTAHDIPDPLRDPDDITEPNPACVVGRGPVLTVMDRSMIAHVGLLNFLRQTADAQGIPYQLKTALGGGTDAGRIHLLNGGIPSAVISMPCRYIHSPLAFLSTEDYANHLRLTQAALNHLDRSVIEQG